MRDHRKLKVFEMSDALVVRVYRMTKDLPIEERFGLQSQMRRAALSVPTNIVEGATRRSQRDYVRFLEIARSSASEVRYLIDIGSGLELLSDTKEIADDYDHLLRALGGLIRTMDANEE